MIAVTAVLDVFMRKLNVMTTTNVLLKNATTKLVASTPRLYAMTTALVLETLVAPKEDVNTILSTAVMVTNVPLTIVIRTPDVPTTQ
jgi:hypothetical protein